MTDESPESNAITRAGCRLVYAMVVVSWLVLTAAVDVVALCVWKEGFGELANRLVERPLAHNLERFGDRVTDGFYLPVLWMGYLVTLLVTSPAIERALQALRHAMASITPTLDTDPSALSPGLRGLVADARALRVALETRDEAMLREVWDWQRRFEQLGESDRRELEHLGLADPGISDLLGWIVAEPERLHRGLILIGETLEQFERRLLESDSLFRGPFR